MVLMGCKHTDNMMNDERPDEYHHIRVASGISTVRLDTYRQVDAFNSSEDDSVAQSDLIDALVVGIALIRKHCERKKYKKRIVMVTDAGSPLRGGVPVDTIVSSLRQEEISFSVVGVAFDPKWDESHFESSRVSSDADSDGDAAMLADNDADNADEERKSVFSDKDRNEIMLHYITNNSGGSVAHLDEALNTLSVMRTRQILQRSMFNGILEISKHLQIAIQVYKKTDATSLPTPKKKSKLAEQSDDLTQRELAEIIREDKFMSVDDPDDDNIAAENRIKAYHYGKDLVPFNESDADSMKLKAEKGALVLGFVPMKQIKRHYFMDDALVFVPPSIDEHAQLAFSSLVHAMEETQRVALIRFVSRSGTDPKIGFLWPYIRPHYECLYYNQLPFTEDVRHYRFRSLDSLTQLNEAQLKAAEDLINSMDLMDAERDIDGEPMEALKPSETFHPIVQHLNNVLHNRALRPSDPIPEIDPSITRYCFPESNPDSFFHKVIIPRSEQPLRRFMEQFPLYHVEQDKNGEKRKKRFWFAMRNDGNDGELTLESYQSGQRKNLQKDSEAMETTAGEEVETIVNADGQAVKRHKPNVDDEGIVGMDAIFHDKAESVGTTNPVKDFRDMLDHRGIDLVEKAIIEMEQVIDKFIEQSIGDQYYQKALDCLIALREGCIREEESERFNSVLQKIKTTHGQSSSKRRAFWEEYLVKKGVTLIHEDEASDSEITKQAAEDFLREDARPPTDEEQSLQEPPADDDDLFGDLE